jgi:hypothetical protein
VTTSGSITPASGQPFHDQGDFPAPSAGYRPRS